MADCWTGAVTSRGRTAAALDARDGRTGGALADSVDYAGLDVADGTAAAAAAGGDGVGGGGAGTGTACRRDRSR